MTPADVAIKSIAWLSECAIRTGGTAPQRYGRRAVRRDTLTLITTALTLLGCAAETTAPKTGAYQLVIESRDVTLVIGDTTTVGFYWLQNGSVREQTAATGRGTSWSQATPTEWRSRDESIAASASGGGIVARGVGSAWFVAARGDALDSIRVTITAASTRAAGIVDAALGGGHACALTETGQAWCWGDMWNAAVGTGAQRRYARSVSPMPVATPGRFTTLVAGTDHTCAMTSASEIYCWGDNRFRQLGSERAVEPSPWRTQGIFDAVDLSAGGDDTCALRGDGTVTCWGASYTGRQAFAPPPGERYTAVATGSNHSCALTKTGGLYCWGTNTYGQLGTGDRLSSAVSRAARAKTAFVRVAAGDNYTCALDSANAVWCWGIGQYGELGLGDATLQTLEPTRVPAPSPLIQLAAGGGHTCALDVDGVAYCWGGNLYGAIGVGRPLTPDPTTLDFVVRTPTRVQTVARYSSIRVGAGNTCGLTREERRLECWGANTTGQLGIGNASWSAGRRYSQRDFPTAVVGLRP